jgi:hypothetical protein
VDKCKGSLNNLFSFSGLFILLYGIFYLNSSIPFPGWYALIPVSGGLLLLAGTSSSWVNKAILSNPLLVWLGLISYPLYLWHGMLLSFSRVIEGDEPRIRIRLAIIMFSIAISWATYKLIEAPIRFGEHKRIKAFILILLLTFCGILGYAVYSSSGFKFRAANNPLEQNAGEIGNGQFDRYLDQKFIVCSSLKLAREIAEDPNSGRGCLQSKVGVPTIAIIGDSHAQALYPGIAREFGSKNVALFARGGWGTQGLPSIRNKKFQHIFEHVINEKSIDTVLINAMWQLRYSTTFIENRSFYNELNETLRALTSAGKNVLLIDDVPTFSIEPKLCKYGRPQETRDACRLEIQKFASQHEEYMPLLASLVEKNPGTTLISLKNSLCDSSFCYMAKGGEIFFRDNNHLNIFGSITIAKWLSEAYPNIFNPLGN